ncbi:MAG TPA: hypothetical protein VD768_04605 [Sphingomicrobium sp.]|nr:hypothetical protein [Sphingomicrobium sp.]
MRPLPNIDVRELRIIADRKWDALISTGRSAIGTDAYDRYLATAAIMLWNGASISDVGDYLVDVETECLGVDTGGGIRERAQALATAFSEYLETCPRNSLDAGIMA